MRVLIAASHRNIVGGLEKYLQTLIPGLVKRGHLPGLLYENAFEAGREAIDSPAIPLDSACVSDQGLPAVIEWAKEWRPDIVYSHGTESALEEALLNTFPSVLYIHTYRGMCISERKCHAYPNVRPCSRPLGAGCLALYLPRRCGGLSPLTMWREYGLQTERRNRFSKYRAILTNSTHMRRELENNGVESGRVSVLRLPLAELAGGALPRSRPFPASEILFVGRLSNVKGADYLLRAMPEAEARLGRKLRLTVAGEGPDRQKLQELARARSINAEFVGWVSSQRRDELMRNAHLLAAPSLWPEPFGLIGIEAGRFGLPAVGYEVGGIPDWLIPGVSGELAGGNPPTVSGLADAIVRAIQDPAHYQKLSEGASQVAERYSLDDHVLQLETILSAHSGSRPCS